MNKIELKEIVLDQNKKEAEKNLVSREIYAKIESYINNPFVIIISGIRRCGKSTLLNQIRAKYSGYYLNFDDDRLVKFGLEDFQTLYEIFIELFGEKSIFYFDEIQNVQGWERFARRLHDNKKKVFITGSNASLLSKELGTHLTGRYIEMNLFPFSFKEFLSFKGFKIDENSIYLTETKAKIKRYFEEYFFNGGFPEYIKSKDREYLKTLYENILYRDIIVRYNLSNEKIMKELVYFITNNISNEISFNSIKKILNLGSSTTVKEYFNFLENSFFIFLVSKFDFSFKRQIYSNKKTYLIDNGMAAHLGYRTSGDLGRLLENIVFIELKRKRKEVYYYSGKKECDFLIREGTKPVACIQVCYDLNQESREREINGLSEAMEKFKLKEGLILTYDQEEEIKLKRKKIIIKPVWKWLIEN